MSDLYDLPDGWEWRTLKEIATIISGYAFKSKDFNKSNDLKCIKITNVGVQSFISEDENRLSSHIVKGLSKYSVKYRDIVIALTRPYISNGLKVTLVPNDYDGAFLNQRVAAIKSDKAILNQKFAYYYFTTPIVLSNVIELSKTLNQPNLSIRDLSIFKLPLPSLSEQQRIVSKLDNLFEKIDKSIALHQKNMDEANVFMGSVLNDVFAELEEKYEKIDFNSVCNKITDGSHNPPKGVENSEYLMLSSKNVFNNSINFNNPRYLKEEDFIRENKRTDVSIGDVLLTIVGTIGRTAVVNIDEKFTLQRSVAVLKPKKELLDSYFLMYSLQKNLDILVDGAKGAAQKGIYLKSIKKLEVINISLIHQQKIVKYLDEVSVKIEKVKLIQKEKMNNLKNLKASILDKAFRCEL
ncbi:MAG: restriction endonuclease subunit S [Halarcobacter sp.]